MVYNPLMRQQYIESAPFTRYNRYKDSSNRILLALLVLYLIIIYNLPLLNVVTDYNILISNSGRFILILLGLVLILYKRNIFASKENKYYIFYPLLFFLIVLISGFSSAEPSLNLILNRIIFDIAGCWIVYLSSILLCKDKKNQKSLAWALAILAAINAIIGVYGAVTGQKILDVSRDEVGVGAFGFDRETGRSGGIRGENYVGAWNAPALALGVILLLSSKSYFIRLIGCSLSLVAIISIIISMSRTSTIASAILLSIIIIIHIRKNKIVKLLILFIFSFLFFQIGKSVFIIQSSRFDPFIRYDIQRRWEFLEILENERKYIWMEYLKMFLEKPFFGHGPGFIKYEYEMGKPVPHNSFLDILIEHGIAGLVLYCFPFILSFKKLYLKPDHEYHIFYFAVFCAIIISLQFLSNPFFKLLWIASGCLEGTKIMYTNQNTTTIIKYPRHKFFLQLL